MKIPSRNDFGVELHGKGVVIMPVCKDCRYYKPIDTDTGLCSGHMVSADQDSEECPAHSFQPIEEEKEK